MQWTSATPRTEGQAPLNTSLAVLTGAPGKTYRTSAGFAIWSSQWGTGGCLCELKVNQLFVAVSEALPGEPGMYCFPSRGACRGAALPSHTFHNRSLLSASQFPLLDQQQFLWRYFIFFASPAKGCHSTLDDSSERARWSSRTARPFPPSRPLWRLTAGHGWLTERRTGKMGYHFPWPYSFRVSWANHCCQGRCPQCRDYKDTAQSQITCCCCSRQRVG